MKTKLGISTALMAAAMYLFALFSGHVVLILAAGYILLFETEVSVKKAAVKAVVISFGFAVLASVIALIPNAIAIVDDLMYVFGGSFSIALVSKIIALVNTVLTVAQKLVLLGFAYMALKEKDIAVPVLDNFLEKHM